MAKPPKFFTPQTKKNKEIEKLNYPSGRNPPRHEICWKLNRFLNNQQKLEICLWE